MHMAKLFLGVAITAAAYAAYKFYCSMQVGIISWENFPSECFEGISPSNPRFI